MPVFSTWVYQCEDGPRHLHDRLEEFAHRLMEDKQNATQRTNAGGWHYAFDLFKLDEPVVAEFRDQMEQHVQGFLNHFRPPERKKKDSFRLEGWINVNRAGPSTRHCHPGCFLSATYYVKAEMKGGEIASATRAAQPWRCTRRPASNRRGSAPATACRSRRRPPVVDVPSWLEHRVGDSREQGNASPLHSTPLIVTRSRGCVPISS
jgi:uncharacterized protein (TIGR02466 family)